MQTKGEETFTCYTLLRQKKGWLHNKIYEKADVDYSSKYCKTNCANIQFGKCSERDYVKDCIKEKATDYRAEMRILTYLTLPAPCISESCIKMKINLNFYFHFSLWCLKKFCEGL